MLNSDRAGYSFPYALLDKLLFSKFKAMLLGDRMRCVLSGGAPLNPETQEFMNIVFGIPVGQGYGSTEVCMTGMDEVLLIGGDCLPRLLHFTHRRLP